MVYASREIMKTLMLEYDLNLIFSISKKYELKFSM